MQQPGIQQRGTLPYTYTPISSSLRTLRLLQLLPADKQDTEIRCRLFEYELQPSGPSSLAYEALSYVWGDQTQTKRIFIEDGYLDITLNLFAALQELRTGVPRLLWVDAIAVNQKDLGERASQVQLMASIYSYAHRVIAWLGEYTQDKARAMAMIKQAAAGCTVEMCHSFFTSPELWRLLQDPYFKRIWVGLAPVETTLDR